MVTGWGSLSLSTYAQALSGPLVSQPLSHDPLYFLVPPLSLSFSFPLKLAGHQPPASFVSIASLCFAPIASPALLPFCSYSAMLCFCQVNIRKEKGKGRGKEAGPEGKRDNKWAGPGPTKRKRGGKRKGNRPRLGLASPSPPFN